MARWEPEGRGRLERAALDLFAERGYDATTVTDIAERAGLTQRTFFRHYPDKREVLFAGGHLLQDAIVTAVRDADAQLGPLDAAVAGVLGGAALLDGRRELAVQRQAIIDAHTDLQERELIKLAAVSAAIAAALRDRGAAEPLATLAADVAITVFRTAFAAWVQPKNRRRLVVLVRHTADRLPALVG